MGHAERSGEAVIDGGLGAQDCTITCRHGGRALAVAVVHRGPAALHAKVRLERALATRSAAAATGGPAP